RWPPSLLCSLLFTLLLCFSSALFLFMFCEGRRRSRRSTRRGPSIWFSVLVLLVSLPYRLFCSPAMSQEDSLTAAVLCLWGVISVEPMVYRRRTSHTEGFVQALQSAMEHHVHHLCSPFLQQGKAESKIFSGFASLHFQRQIRSILRPDPSLFGKLIPSLTTLQPCLHLFVNLMSDVGGNPLRRLALSHLWESTPASSSEPSKTSKVMLFAHNFHLLLCCGEYFTTISLFMNGANFSDSFSSFSFSLLTGLLPCGAVCTGPEGAIETTSVFLVGENCLSTSLVINSKLSDFVVKASPTHSSIVSNSLSSLVEDLSRLAYLFVAFYAYGKRRWMIPSFCCTEED
ncbi:hypothetical protein HID58_089937, partial [Brassica napus]